MALSQIAFDLFFLLLPVFNSIIFSYIYLIIIVFISYNYE